jgi:hypothetical protein
MAARLDGLDGRTRGNAAHHRHRNRPAAFVLGGGAHPAQIALDDTWCETAAAARSHAMSHRFGKLDHLDGPRPVRQAADKSALFKSRDQPMDAGLGAQVERILHFVERGRHSRFLKALVDEP